MIPYKKKTILYPLQIFTEANQEQLKTAVLQYE